MLPLGDSAILLTCIKRKSVLKTIFGVLFERPLKTGFTVPKYLCLLNEQSRVTEIYINSSAVSMFFGFFCCFDKHLH